MRSSSPALTLIGKDVRAFVTGLANQVLAERYLERAIGRMIDEYDDIDPDKLHGALRDAIQDIPAYVQQVVAFVDSLEPRTS